MFPSPRCYPFEASGGIFNFALVTRTGAKHTTAMKQWAILVVGCAWVLSGLGKEPTLKIGMAAPPLQPGRWLQGPPVKEFERDKAYLVVFWAAWAEPGPVLMTHLNRLAAKFKEQGLVVLAQTVWEQDPAIAAAYAKEAGLGSDCRLAFDEPLPPGWGPMATNWLDAADQGAVPVAFLVDKQGRLAWIGHPCKVKFAQIEQLLAGTFDPKKAAQDAETLRQNDAELLKVWNRAKSCVRQQHWDHVEPRFEEMAKLLPEGERDCLDLLRFRMLLGRKNKGAALQLASALSDRCPDEALLQNQLAWELLISGPLEAADLDLAEKIARRANEAAAGQDAAILDTLARAFFLKGRKQEALELQEKAVKLATENNREELEATLRSYQAGKLPYSEP